MQTNNREKNNKGTKIREQVDWLLQLLVSLVNTRNVRGIFVTLNVGGLLVCGELTGAKHYFEEFGKDFASGDETLEKFFKDLGDKLCSDLKEKPRLDFSFIHLRNARFYYPGQQPIPTNQGIRWRSKLEAIDAFSLGSLEVTAQQKLI